MANSTTTTLTTVHVAGFDIVSARDLVAADLPPIEMVVGGVLPAGLILLAGDPKAGKTLVVTDLAMSIASGTPAWGGLPVPEGDVLYISNEGGLPSFCDRLRKMAGSDSATPDAVPQRLSITSTDAQLGGPLEAQLQAWLDQADDPRLVVIDTLSSVAPVTGGNNRHAEDYKLLKLLADLAVRYPGLLIIVVHHTRKAEGEDVMHRITGSQGLAAATDGNAVLARGTASNRCRLYVRPRNAEECELVLERGPNLRWTVVEGGEQAMLSASRQAILKWLKLNPGGHGPKEIAAALGMTDTAVRKLLSDMAEAGQVRRIAHGIYDVFRQDERQPDLAA